MPTLATIIQYSFESPSDSKQRESNKKKSTLEIKLSLFPGDMILYTENPKRATRQLVELNEFGKFAGYRINIQKCVICAH